MKNLSKTLILLSNLNLSVGICVVILKLVYSRFIQTIQVFGVFNYLGFSFVINIIFNALLTAIGFFVLRALAVLLKDK